MIGGESAGLQQVEGLAHPELLWLLLLLLPLAIVHLWRSRRWRVPHAPLQYRGGPAWRSWLARTSLPIELAVAALVVVALSNPYREQQLELIEDPGIDVVLVLDVSLSMMAEDFPPNRLQALQTIARDFVDRSGGHRLGIVIFAGDAYVQSPLTTDKRAIGHLLESSTAHAIDQAQSGGTAIGDALLIAGQRLEKAKVEGRDQAVVLITDGESNIGIDPLLAARQLRELDIRLYAIGIGGEKPMPVRFQGRQIGGDTPYLTSLDDQQLRELATAANGRYDRATDVTALENLFSELSRLESAPLEVRTIAQRRSLAWIPALLAFVAFAGHLYLQGQVLRRPLR